MVKYKKIFVLVLLLLVVLFVGKSLLFSGKKDIKKKFLVVEDDSFIVFINLDKDFKCCIGGGFSKGGFFFVG